MTAARAAGLADVALGQEITDCYEAARVLRPGSPLRCRQSVARRRHVVADGPCSLPVFQIVFDLTYQAVKEPASGCVTVQLVLVPRTCFAWTGPRRVVYDRTFRSTAVAAFLQSTHSFLPLRIAQHAWLPLPARMAFRHELHAHSIRVLPIAPPPRPRPAPAPVAATIAPHLLRRIIRHTRRAEKLNHWRPSILRYALVCRAWSHLLDLSFPDRSD